MKLRLQSLTLQRTLAYAIIWTMLALLMFALAAAFLSGCTSSPGGRQSSAIANPPQKPHPPGNFRGELIGTGANDVNLMPAAISSIHPPGTNIIRTPLAGRLTWSAYGPNVITNDRGETLTLNYAIICCTNVAGLRLTKTGTAPTAIGPARWWPYTITTNTSCPVICTNIEAYFQIEAFYALQPQ